MHSVSTNNTWTVCIQLSCTDSVPKLLSRAENSLILGSSFQPPRQRSGHTVQLLQRDTLVEKLQKQLLSSFQNTKLAQTSRSVFADKIAHVEETGL